VIRLCYSNHTEALCEALSENLAAGRTSLFDPVHLIVPNPLVEGYVKQALARRLGIAAHIETQFLRGFLGQIARASAPEILIVDRDLCEGELLALLADPARLTPRDLGPVRGYLSVAAGGDASDEEGLDRKRVQLAAQLAGLFDEYAFSRPEMLATWRNGALVPDLDEPLQRWQRELSPMRVAAQRERHAACRERRPQRWIVCERDDRGRLRHVRQRPIEVVDRRQQLEGGPRGID